MIEFLVVIGFFVFLFMWISEADRARRWDRYTKKLRREGKLDAEHLAKFEDWDGRD